MSDIKVRTPEAHNSHIIVRWNKTCGCATANNTKQGEAITRCVCACAYLTSIVSKIKPFICYDCKRLLHTG